MANFYHHVKLATDLFFYADDLLSELETCGINHDRRNSGEVFHQHASIFFVRSYSTQGEYFTQCQDAKDKFPTRFYTLFRDSLDRQ